MPSVKPEKRGSFAVNITNCYCKNSSMSLEILVSVFIFVFQRQKTIRITAIDLRAQAKESLMRRCAVDAYKRCRRFS